jgi:PEGA domain-containing protein
MEYLLVNFGSPKRRVIVDGSPFGFTDAVIQIDAGNHEITLEPPPDFSPVTQNVLIQNTSPLAPLNVTFHRLPASAIPPAPGARP